MNTKERILLEAMKLFSIHGYESVSVRAIAAEVGIGNSALYKHYASKNDIFDAIVVHLKDHFCKTYQEKLPECTTLEGVKKNCLSMFRFQTEDSLMVMFRRILQIEQFKNPEMARIFKEFYVEAPVQAQAQLFQEMIQMGYMKDRNATVMAMELYAPFFLYHTVSFDKEKLNALFEQHVDNFFESYIIQAGD